MRERGTLIMATKFCTQCGAPLLEGKKFCTGCGKSLLQPTVTAGQAIPLSQAAADATELQSTPAGGPASEPLSPILREYAAVELPVEQPPVTPVQPNVDAGTELRLCTQCHQPVAAGKRFCGKCGHPVTESVPIEAPASPSDSPQLFEIPVPIPTVAAEPIASGELSAASPTLFDQPAPASPAWEPETQASAAFMPVPDAERISTSWSTRLQSLVTQKTAILVGVCILVAAACATGLWMHHRRTMIGAASGKPAIAAPVSAAPSAPAESSAVASAATSPKPNAGKALGAPQPESPAPISDQVTAPASNRTAPLPVVAQAHIEVPRIPAAPSENRAGPGNGSPLAKISEPPRSGVLHYDGPSVPYGGTIVFRNLPGGRLRFVFDRTSWQALISRQPDGTQTLTLRSIRHADQSQCDVQWEALQ